MTPDQRRARLHAKGGVGELLAEQPTLTRIVEDGPFGFAEVNIARHRRDPEALLNWVDRPIRRRRECPAGLGRRKLLDTGDAAVFAHRADWDLFHRGAVHNLAAREAPVRLELGGEAG